MKRTIFRIILIMLIGFVCGLIFYFSHQPAVSSDGTSQTVARKIIDVFPYTKNLTNSQKKRLVERINPIIRKLAHLSIYTLVGILIMTFVSTYKITLLKKLLISIAFGSIYASTDEIHQIFVPRKKCRNKRCINRFAEALY